MYRGLSSSIVIGRTLWLAALLTLLPSCALFHPPFEEPTVKLANLQLLEPQGVNPRFRIGLVISNPNNTTLPVTGLRYRLSLNGHDVISGVTNDIPELAAYAETPVALEASTDLVEALRLVNALADRPQNQLEYAFKADLDLAGWRPTLKINREGSIEIQRH